MDLGAFTADLASSFRSAMELNNITYTIDCEPLPSKDHLIYTDRDFWEKVVFNLIGNSFKVRLSHSHKGVGMSRKLTTYAVRSLSTRCLEYVQPSTSPRSNGT